MYVLCANCRTCAGLGIRPYDMPAEPGACPQCGDVRCPNAPIHSVRA